MITSVGNITDESQASQVIANALRGTGVVVEALKPQSVEDDPCEGRSFSNSSIPSQVPQYHFFGLANTQTQSENASKKGFQYDPLSSQLGDPKLSDQRASTRVKEYTDLSIVSVASDIQCKQAGRGEKAIGRASATPVSGQPPKPRKFSGQKATSPEPRRILRQRSLSPASDDSFAGPLPYQVQEKRYMERSKNFQVPLSELGCSQDSCIGGDPSDHLPASSSPPPMYASLPQNRRAEPPSARPGPRGEVLVAATPTNSSQISSRLGVSELQSQDRFQVGSSHSQESDLFQGGQAQIADQDFEPFTQAQIRDRAYSSDDDRYDEALPTQLSSPRCAPTEPSSSYSNLPGFVGGETQVATQIMDEATQPTESVSTGCDTGRLVTYAVDSDISQPALSPRQLSSEVAPRSLLSMVNPAKRWRLAGFKPLPEGPLPADTDTHVDETVLDNLTELYAQEYSRLRNHRGGDADSNQLTQSLPNPKKLSKDDGYPKALNASDLEIVPDSEATQPALVDYSHIPNAVTHLQESSLPQKAAEREQSQEEDDVPLAHQSNRVKGKSVLSRKVPVQEMPPPFTARRPLTPTISSTKTDAGLPSNKVADFGEADIVPSSNPQQDHPKTSRPSSKGRGKASAKSRLNTPAILESRIASPQLSNLTAESSDSAFPPIRECDQDTEPAGDNFMEVDSHDALPTTNRKRKRTTSSSKARPMSRTSTRTTKSLTPATRPAKRAKSSSVLRSGIAPATRIFALWKQDGHYYPGTVHSLFEATTSRYVIHFDDKTEDVVELSKMRLCQLKRGDNVLLCETNEKARVADDSQCAPDSLINVEFGRGAAQSQFAVNIQDIRVATRTIASQWKDRMLHVDDVVPVVKPRSLKQSPTPSRLSLASLGSAKNTRGVLANTGLVVTLSPGNDNWSTDKDRLMSSIKNNGGYVIDDWGSIFNMDGNFSLDGKRWTVCGEDVVFTREELDRVFLLSDDSNRKPKFLMALALGIPCLSIDWLERTTKELKDIDWQPYLLPAGFCEQLETHVSQLVDLAWGNSPLQLQEIMENPVPVKIFSGKNVLCLASDFVPLLKSKRGNHGPGKAKEAQGMVPLIILCMGASQVEAVVDVKYASRKLHEYDYVVVKEVYDKAQSNIDGVNCVNFGWVKDCLIMGRLLPNPKA